MEIKKSHSADLERWRHWRLLFGVIVAVALLVGVMEIPFSGREKQVYADDDSFISEDLSSLTLPERNDMIPSSLLEPEKKTVISETDDPLAVVAEPVEASVEGATVTSEVSSADSLIEDKPQSIPMQTDDQVLPLRIVQQIPEFPGGMSGFSKWLTRNIHYPPESRKYKIQGQVVVSFVIEKDGTTTGLKIEKSAETRLDAEVMRVMKLMPKWKPGLQDNEPCRTLFVVPVTFKI